MIGTGIPHSGRPAHDLYLSELRAVMATAAGVRRLGAPRSTSPGPRRPARRLLGTELRAWDLAAGIVILREAGGFVSDAEGKDAMLAQGSVVAGNEAIAQPLSFSTRRVLIGLPRSSGSSTTNLPL